MNGFPTLNRWKIAAKPREPHGPQMLRQISAIRLLKTWPESTYMGLQYPIIILFNSIGLNGINIQ